MTKPITDKQVLSYGKRMGLRGKKLAQFVRYVQLREDGLSVKQAKKVVAGVN